MRSRREEPSLERMVRALRYADQRWSQTWPPYEGMVVYARGRFWRRIYDSIAAMLRAHAEYREEEEETLTRLLS